MTHWSIIHTRFPEVCEGGGKRSGWKGCAAWSDGQSRCNHVVQNLSGPLGECTHTEEAAAEIQRRILRGQI